MCRLSKTLIISIILLFNQVLSVFGFEGSFTDMNIGESENLPKSLKVSKGKLAISLKVSGLIEASKDLNTWYGIQQGRRYLSKMDQEKIFYRVRKLMPRTVKTYVPKGYDKNRKHPLIINLHGFTGDWEHQNGYFPLQKHADNNGFIFCVPDGEYDGNDKRRWNAIDACCGTREDLPDDSTYLKNIITQAKNNFNIDDDRIYCMGFSNGGMMSYRMAIDHSDVLAGIVVIGGISYKDKKYAPKNPIHVLHVHGTQEENFHGTELGDLQFYHAATPSVEDNLKNWAEFNQCEILTISEKKLNLVERLNGNETTVINYKNDSTGCDVELWKVAGGIHVEEYSSEMKKMMIDWILSKRKIYK